MWYLKASLSEPTTTVGDSTSMLELLWRLDLGGSVVKNPPAKQEMWVLYLGWEDTLEKDMATHFIILAWKIPWTQEPGGLWSMGSQGVELDLVTK